jgi:hypothetical protein
MNSHLIQVVLHSSIVVNYYVQCVGYSIARPDEPKDRTRPSEMSALGFIGIAHPLCNTIVIV